MELKLIDLDQKRTGYRQFISCWLYQSADVTFIVDPGPTSSADFLISKLRESVTSIDYILLTHIHLDHAGGTGTICKAFPEAKVVCFEPAVTHMVDPAKLWEGSQKVLREIADLFGQPEPVPEDKFVPATSVPGLQTILTPGHAKHHQSYIFDDILFVGEAAGLRLNVDGQEYLRPATPPRFFPKVAVKSLDKLLAMELPSRCAFAHYGMAENCREILELARDQHKNWVEILKDNFTDYQWSPQLQAEALELLIEKDPLLTPFKKLPADLQVREQEFFRNTLEGMLGYLSI
ncbi:MAG: MBL fold metallo-hydrolase [bacterium]|nr:MBL fold metallo-hydrolase [bacterium]